MIVSLKLNSGLFQQLLNLLGNVLNVLCGLETGYHLSLLVDEELGEVPLDGGFLLIVGILFRQHLFENRRKLMIHVPSGEAFLLLQELEEGVGIVAVYLDFLEAWELSAEVQFTELVDALVGTRGLLSELVAWEVEDLEALSMVLLVERLQLIILRGESTLGCCIDKQKHLIGVLFQRYVFTFSVLDREFINGFHS